MKLYGVNDVTQKVESYEVKREAPKHYHLEDHVGALRRRRCISKDDPMIAFSPEEALERYKIKQYIEISILEGKIIFIKDKINKAKINALH